MHISIEPNALYYGDCLEVMAQFPSEYVDLIYLDPPFNSDEKYNTIFKGRHGLRNIDPQIKAFDDTWTWNDASAQRVAEVKGAVAKPPLWRNFKRWGFQGGSEHGYHCHSSRGYNCCCYSIFPSVIRCC